MVPNATTAIDTTSLLEMSFAPAGRRPRPVRAASSATVEFSESLRSQCAEVAHTIPGDSGLTLTCTAMPERLPRAVATRLTVIAMELIDSALNAFEGGRGGRIAVSFSTIPAAWQLTVERSGPGTATVSRRGATRAALIQALVAPMGGGIEHRRMMGGDRTVVTVPCTETARMQPPHLTLVPATGARYMNETPHVAVEQPAGIPVDPAALPTDEPLRRAVEEAVPEAERLPSGADENPISQRVRDAGEDTAPPAEPSRT